MKKKAKIWEHQFVCLASKTQCGAIDRGNLMQAGLGGKTLSFVDTCDAEMFHEHLHFLSYVQEGDMNCSVQTNETIVLWMLFHHHLQAIQWNT